jgi:hypothetical protein
MKEVTNIINAFFRGITHSRVSLMGAMIVTVVFPFLIGAILYDIYLHIENTYFAGFIYMLLGPLFLGGLVLVFLGLFFFKGKEEVRLFTLEYLQDYFTDPTKFSKLRRILFFTVFLTCVNLFIFGILAYRGYHYMESTGFCGTFCHTVMNPEYTAYQNSPHSRVTCVECHIGGGAEWFVKSKISGARQLLAVAFDTHPRPIETPVHGLRPARDTCQQCHRPEIFHGDRLVIKEKFLSDEANTKTYTALLMRVGSAGDQATGSHGIHWHVAPENEITYQHADYGRQIIPIVKMTGANGGERIFRSGDADEIMTDAATRGGGTRIMDCIDCHNRPSHIFLPPDQAIDRKILEGDIPKELPFIKRQAMAVATRTYSSSEEARTVIATELHDWYQANYPGMVKRGLVDRAIRGVQAAYAENVFPEMNIQWNTYVNHIAHTADFDPMIGCIRCHNDEHETPAGEVISMNCDTCHTILIEDAREMDVPQLLRRGR